MIKLGTKVVDKATGLEGHLSHYQVEGGYGMYNFQPAGLDPEKGAPINSYWVSPDRIEGGVTVPDSYLGLEVLGTIVKDTKTGFEGTAVASILHLNGCLHIDVQPKGKGKDGGKLGRHNFDIRELSGEAFEKKDSAAAAAQTSRVPSPAAHPRLRE